MKAMYWQTGDNLDYVNGTDAVIEPGTVVSLNDERIAVAATQIAPGAVGVVATVGVFVMDKAAGAIAQGAAVSYDKTADKIGAGTANIPAGFAAEAAADADETVKVKIG
ncbi:MAG: DUF2190 family protein [Eubacteriales bacterium]|nr:DUF2190 family protein [Eubacteriales bacterium]